MDHLLKNVIQGGLGKVERASASRSRTSNPLLFGVAWSDRGPKGLDARPRRTPAGQPDPSGSRLLSREASRAKANGLAPSAPAIRPAWDGPPRRAGTSRRPLRPWSDVLSW